MGFSPRFPLFFQVPLMNAPFPAERTEPTFADNVPYAPVAKQLSLFSDVAGEMTALASDELQTAQQQNLGHDAIDQARKNLQEALEHAADAAKALEAAYAAQAAHLRGASAFLNSQPEQGKPFFDIAGEKLGQARSFVIGALDRVAKSSFLNRVMTSVITRMEAADARIEAGAAKADAAIGKGVDGFLSVMRRTADTMGRMVTAVKETPGRLLESAKATGRSISDTTAYYVAQTQHQLVTFGQDVKADVMTMADATRDAAIQVGAKVRDGAVYVAGAGIAAGVAVRDQAIVAHENVKQVVRTTQDVGEAVVRTGVDTSVDAAKTMVKLGGQALSGMRARFAENLDRVQAQRAAAQTQDTPRPPKAGL